MQDILRRYNAPLTRSFPRRVAEVAHEFEENVADFQEVESQEISAIALNCWNCHKSGHRYQDCLAPRTIFCYGCGEPDTYKPNCKKCQQKNVKAWGVNRPQKKPETETE